MFCWEIDNRPPDSCLVGTLWPREGATRDWCAMWKNLQLPNPNKWVTSCGMPFGEARTVLAYTLLNEGFQWLFMLDSVPGYTPVVVRDKETHEVDVLPISMLTQFDGEGLQRIPCEKYQVFMGRNAKSTWTDIKHVVRHPWQGKLMRISTVGGSLDVSPNHSVFKHPSGSTPNLVDASLIKEGDRLAMPEQPPFSYSRKTFFLGRCDLAWLYGLFAAEGSVSGMNVRVSNTNLERLEKAQQIFEDYFNRPFHIVDESKEGAMFHLQATDKKLAAYFDEMFYTDARDKKVPKVILNASTGIKIAFLKGYHEGDGHRRSTADFGIFTTVSPCLAEGVLFLLHCAGLDSVSVQRRSDKPNVFQLTVNKQCLERKDRARVSSISQFDYDGYVYDISTESERFRGGVGGFLLHNSDVIVPEDTVMRFINYRLPIVSALYPQRYPVFDGINAVYRPCIFREGRDEQGNPIIVPITEFQYGQLLEVDYAPGGAMLIHRSVFETLLKAGVKDFFEWTMRPTTNPRGKSEDFTFCVPPGALVYGPDIKPIEEIAVGDKVITHRGTTGMVTEIFKRDYAGPLVELKATYAPLLSLTPNHPVLVKRGRRKGGQVIEWLPAIDVKVGDYAFVPKLSSKSRKFKSYISLHHYISASKAEWGKEIYYKRTHRTAPRIPVRIDLTNDFLRLLGYYIAEGCTGAHQCSVIFCFGKAEKETLVKDTVQIIKAVFGLKASLYETRTSLNVVVSSKVLAHLFTNLCGHGARHKHLPKFWWQLSNAQLTSLLEGWWKGDGGTTVSKTLVHQAKTALLRLGILVGCYVGSHRNQILVATDHKKAFNALLRLDKKEKERKRGAEKHFKEIQHLKLNGTTLNGGFWVKIRSVGTRQYDGPVHNFAVGKFQSYVLEGVTVHNCERARAVGYKIIVDTGVQAAHEVMAQVSVRSGLLPRI